MEKRIWLIMSLLALVVLAGCSIKESVPLPPIEPGTVIFEDDFTGDDLGSAPSNWVLNDQIAQYGHIEVVADDGVPSGRAVHLRANKYTERHSLNMRTEDFGEMARGVKTMGIEYWLKWVEGGAVYHYISRGTPHRIMFLPSGNKLDNRQTGESGNVSVRVADLVEGWNHIRVIANRETRELIFYVNDMETPVSGEFQSLSPIETWEDLRIILVHETTEDEYREAYYSGFKVWVVE